jgi:hypothetical protein
MNNLIDPAVYMLLLFRTGEQPEKEAKALRDPWLSSPRLTFLDETVGQKAFHNAGRRDDGTDCRLDYCLAHDTHLLRLQVSRSGAQEAQVWAELTQRLKQAMDGVWTHPDYPRPWAVTWLYTSLLPVGADGNQAQSLVAGPEGPALDAWAAQNLDSTPFGWLGQGKGEEPNRGGAAACVRRLVLLTPQDRADAVRTYFLEPMTQGSARIELYLHKALHHARLYTESVGSAACPPPVKTVREDLEETRQSLETATQKVLAIHDLSRLRTQQVALQTIADKLMLFLMQKGRVDVLLNSLDTNLHMVREHLNLVQLKSFLYEHQVEQLGRQYEQMQTDLRYADATLRAVQPIQDIQRQVEGLRLERSSFLLGAAATVLTGVAVFNSFIDIWSQAVAGSGLSLPAPLWRVALGLTAAVSMPAAAYWAATRRWWRAAISFALVLASVAMAVASTVWTSP